MVARARVITMMIILSIAFIIIVRVTIIVMVLIIMMGCDQRDVGYDYHDVGEM